MTPSHSLAAKEHEKLPPFGIDRNFVLVPPSTADVDKYQFSTYHYYGLRFMAKYPAAPRIWSKPCGLVWYWWHFHICTFFWWLMAWVGGLRVTLSSHLSSRLHIFPVVDDTQTQVYVLRYQELVVLVSSYQSYQVTNHRQTWPQWSPPIATPQWGTSK